MHEVPSVAPPIGAERDETPPIGVDPGPDGTAADDAAASRAITLRTAVTSLGLVAACVVVFGAAFVGVHLAGLVEVSGATLPVLLVGLTVASVLALHLYLGRRHALTWTDLGFRRPTWRLLHLLWQLPATLVVAANTQAAVSALTSGGSTGAPRDGALDELLTGSALLGVLAIVVVAVVTPVWEEVLFRGALLAGFRSRFGPVLSVVLTAVVFALVHGFPPTMPYLFVIGLSLGWVRLFHDNLWASVALHAANNALVLIVVMSAV
jgi:hypothetical protein